MAKQIPDIAMQAIEDVVRRNPNGVSAPEILRVLTTQVPPRTLQYRLKQLVTRNRLVMDGEGRWARYRISDAPEVAAAVKRRAKGTPYGRRKGTPFSRSSSGEARSPQLAQRVAAG